ncbi:SGNH/GDSL hydrolase family protein [Nonomuraea sp. NPDC050394]|uniref:SGNH/GDSL hydrolase family protein n=1 Tax=Nonomuraea sp. NPDC050394 TaxID=3364363 RepID=UPI003787801D
MTRILVLGDSSSAGIGAPQQVYPVHLATGGSRVENHAVPGLTSADAARYFVRKPARRRWDVVIVYLGNNEAFQQGRKGAYRPWLDVGRRRILARETRLERLVLSETDDELPSATTSREFRANLEVIIRTARRNGARVVLANPVANPGFPPALMGAYADSAGSSECAGGWPTA